MKALVGAFNQEKALVGAFSVIVQPVVEPMDRFAALVSTNPSSPVQHRGADGGGRQQVGAVRAQAALRRHLARTPVVELRQTRADTWSPLHTRVLLPWCGTTDTGDPSARCSS